MPTRKKKSRKILNKKKISKRNYKNKSSRRNYKNKKRSKNMTGGNIGWKTLKITVEGQITGRKITSSKDFYKNFELLNQPDLLTLEDHQNIITTLKKIRESFSEIERVYRMADESDIKNTIIMCTHGSFLLKAAVVAVKPGALCNKYKLNAVMKFVSKLIELKLIQGEDREFDLKEEQLNEILDNIVEESIGDIGYTENPLFLPSLPELV